MIEIVKEKVEMPTIDKCIFQKEFKNNKWFVINSETNNIIFRGKFVDVVLACHNLNKKYYRDRLIV